MEQQNKKTYIRKNKELLIESEKKEDNKELEDISKKSKNNLEDNLNDNNNFLDTMFSVLKEVTDDIKKRKTPTKNKDN